MNRKKKKAVQTDNDVLAELIQLAQTPAQLEYLCYKSPQAIEEKNKDSESRIAYLQQEQNSQIKYLESQIISYKKESEVLTKLIVKLQNEMFDRMLRYN